MQRAIASLGSYSSSKFAVRGFTEALMAELQTTARPSPTSPHYSPGQRERASERASEQGPPGAGKRRERHCTAPQTSPGASARSRMRPAVGCTVQAPHVRVAIVHPGHVGTNIAINSRAPEMLPKDSAEVNKRRKLVGWVTGEDLSRLSRGELEKRMRENFRDQVSERGLGPQSLRLRCRAAASL